MRRGGATALATCLVLAALSGCAGDRAGSAAPPVAAHSEHGEHGEQRSASDPYPGALRDDGTVELQPGGPGDPVRTATAAPEPFPSLNPGDIAFLQQMVPHHQQALVLTDLAALHARSRSVRALAERIAVTQAPEISLMESWLADAGTPLGHDGHDADHSAMAGMLTEAQLDALAAARGARFDELFLRGMIAHHRGALTMAREVIGEGRNQRVKELATDIIAGQSAEIARMDAVLRAIG